MKQGGFFNHSDRANRGKYEKELQRQLKIERAKRLHEKLEAQKKAKP